MTRLRILSDRRRRLPWLTLVRTADCRGKRDRLPRQFLHGNSGQHPAPAGPSTLRGLRHDVQEQMTIEVDQIYIWPARVARALPTQSGANIRTAVEARSTCWTSPANAGTHTHSFDVGGIRDPPCTTAGRILGKREPSGPRSCYDEGKRCAEALASRTASQYTWRANRPVFNTYGPLCARRRTGGLELVVQALRGKSSRCMGTGSNPLVLLVTDLVEGLCGSCK